MTPRWCENKLITDINQTKKALFKHVFRGFCQHSTNFRKQIPWGKTSPQLLLLTTYPPNHPSCTQPRPSQHAANAYKKRDLYLPCSFLSNLTSQQHTLRWYLCALCNSILRRCRGESGEWEHRMLMQVCGCPQQLKDHWTARYRNSFSVKLNVSTSNEKPQTFSSLNICIICYIPIPNTGVTVTAVVSWHNETACRHD